jgi:hypothetical protein
MKDEPIMTKMLALLFSFGVALTLSPSAPTYANDHLVTAGTATQGKLDIDSLPDSPGQGAPFTSNDISVPATEVREDDQRAFPGVGPESGTAPNGKKFQ